MVDSVEHRVEMHRIGRERREAGKPRWDQTVAIAAYIHEQYSDNKVVNSWHVMRNVADLITERLGKYLEIGSPDWNMDFADMIEDMRERSVESLAAEDNAEEAVNNYLSEIYDFFDYHNIWAGAGAAKIVKLVPNEEAPRASV